MSADNTIVVLKTNTKVWRDNSYELISVFRVEEITNFENIQYYQNSELHNLGAYLLVTFGKSPKFPALEEANKHAEELADKIEQEGRYLEYGIQFVDFSQYTLFGD